MAMISGLSLRALPDTGGIDQFVDSADALGNLGLRDAARAAF
jgi:hypothetical protein